ncbi:S9 family peptidase [Aureibaculum sp. A20]|uniref:S9 family peptidase n=1 Tax=Aureibaculum flavum TaxID=2795986 RepID=A0ABS0WR59_9FLAO|nr:prolyl oligopeptidase family serine peptidase [Aureibaculum flavum]MBJ2174411.1 S9 family peptidase [Aureibaculum flavum]
MRTLNHQRTYSLFLGLLMCSLVSFGQTQKPLTLDDYAQWNKITNTAISPNGNWVTFSYVPNEGDATLHIKKTEGDTLRTAINGKNITFAPNSKWVAYLVDPAKKEADKLKKAKKPVLSDLQILNLENNEVSEVKNVKGYHFSKTSEFIAIQKNPMDKKADHKGSDVLLKDLNKDITLNIGNVASYAFSKEGTLFSYVVDANEDDGNGLFLIDLNTLRTYPLHTGKFTYAQMTWNKKGDRLAALFGTKIDTLVERENKLFYTSKLSSGITTTITPNIYSPEGDSNFPKQLTISNYGNLTWNEAGTQITFGVKAQKDVIKKDDLLKADVDVWHYKDERIQSRQAVQAKRDEKATYTAVLNLENKKFIPLENEEMPNVNVSKKSDWAVGSVDTLYRKDVNIVRGYTDLYSINTKTGAKKLIAKRVLRNMGMSPNGEWALFSKDGAVMGYHFAKGTLSNLTERTGINFANEDYDIPVEKPTYGIAGWSKNGETLLLNHKFDIWSISLNSEAASNLTQGLGTEGKIRFRLLQLDPEEETFDLSKPLLLYAFGDRTKKSGYYELTVGKKPKVLRYEDKMTGRIIKAKDTDNIIFTQQTFVDFPDYWTSNLAFKRPKKITNANPQQADFKWSKRVLVDYTDERGNELQATLALPADYDASKKYPMIVYFYEKMSNRHHQYSMPTYDDRPHMSTYASNGYLVLMPDIVFDEGLPGSSALDDVTSAAKEVIKLGYADPDHIGLQGHSWGGYESSFIVTQTDMFATVVTGAPLTNLVSMYNIAYKRSGSLNGPILEWSQGRMGVSPYENLELYQSQSPVHHAKNINTPFLILHGTSDGAVDWNQGLEFYSAARRLGKEVILLSYPNEPHHLAKEENQKDFQIRMKQYFDYYLKDSEAPLWIKEGIKHADKKRVGPEVLKKGE